MTASDFSASCEFAFRFAKKISDRYGSKLFLFHMLPVPPQPAYSQTKYEADLGSARRRLAEISEEIAADHTKVEIHVKGGVFPYLEIIEFAERKEVDLIVIGSHTKNDDQKWYVGSVVEYVGRKAPCPALVVTDPEVIE